MNQTGQKENYEAEPNLKLLPSIYDSQHMEQRVNGVEEIDSPCGSLCQRNKSII